MKTYEFAAHAPSPRAAALRAEAFLRREGISCARMRLSEGRYLLRARRPRRMLARAAETFDILLEARAHGDTRATLRTQTPMCAIARARLAQRLRRALAATEKPYGGA